MREIPDKSWFKIGEIERIVDIRQHTLRAWERDFPELKPSKTPSGQRIYHRKDAELLLVLRELMVERKFTVEGARRELQRYDALRIEVLGEAAMASTSSSRRAAPRKAAAASASAPIPAQQSVLDGLQTSASEPTGAATPAPAAPASIASAPVGAGDDTTARMAAQLSQALEREESARRAAESAAEQLRSQLLGVSEQLAQLQTRIESLDAERSQAVEEVQSLQRTLETANHKVRALESAADTLRERAARSKEELDRVRAASAAHWNALVADVSGWG